MGGLVISKALPASRGPFGDSCHTCRRPVSGSDTGRALDRLVFRLMRLRATSTRSLSKRVLLVKINEAPPLNGCSYAKASVQSEDENDWEREFHPARPQPGIPA